MRDVRDYVVLITGATSGIGLSMAKVFAQRGNTLIITASDQQRLNITKRALQKAYHVSVEAICQDLSEPDAARKLYQKIKEKKYMVNILVNNAGFGLVGSEKDLKLEQEEKMLAVNITALTQLCHLFLKDMSHQKEGKILNVASTGAFQPGPYTAAYFARKSYVASFSRALRVEAQEYGVQVCTLYPGSTRTAFFEKTGTRTPIWAMNPDKVARIAYVKLWENEGAIMPGIIDRIVRWIPSEIKIRFIAKMKHRK